VLAFQPTNAPARFALAATLERRGETAEALKNYLAVPIDLAEGVSANLRAGILHCRLGQFAEALICLQECARRGTDSNALLFYRGTALAFSGQLNEAIHDWRRLHERCPDSDRVTLNLARAYYLAGSQNLNADRVEEAVASWEEYLRLYPADERAARDLAELYFQLAAMKLTKPQDLDLGGALKLLRSALDRDRQNGVYAFYLALCELRCGNIDSCLAGLRSLLASEGRRTRILYHTGICLLQKGASEEAVLMLEEIQRTQPNDTYAEYAGWALANEKLRHGKTEEAMALLSQRAQELQAQD